MLTYFFIIGIIGVLSAFLLLAYRIRILIKSKKCVGIYVDNIIRSSNGRKYKIGKIVYQDSLNDEYTIQEALLPLYRKIGSQVNVRYNIDKPSIGYVDNLLIILTAPLVIFLLFSIPLTIAFEAYGWI
jgi:hypothetical protein